MVLELGKIDSNLIWVALGMLLKLSEHWFPPFLKLEEAMPTWKKLG